MGKASRWLRSLLTFRTTPSQTDSTRPPPPKDKRRWSFVKSNRHNHPPPPPPKQQLLPYGHQTSSHDNDDEDVVLDPDKHAIAVAAATAAVAEAAVTAANAAAAVVKLTSSGRADSTYYSGARCGSGVARRERRAAVVIQSAFRGYLARRALKALKALVRLQALVRGHIARRQTVDQVRQMQAILRVQARARAGRAILSESSQSSSKSSYHHPPGPATPEKVEQVRSRSPRRNQPLSLKRNSSRSESRVSNDQVRPHKGTNWTNHTMDVRVWDPLMRTGPLDEDKSDKILEIDPGRPVYSSKLRSLSHASGHGLSSAYQSHSQATSKDSTALHPTRSYNSFEAMSLSPLKFSCEPEDASFCTAENSPHFYSASSVGGGSSRGGPLTPTKSDSMQSFLSGYSDHPNYMSYTESSKAKLRSLSAPKQRPQYERSSSMKRYSYHAFGETKSGAQTMAATHASFANKAYPGSGRLDKLGMPLTRSDQLVFGSGHD